MEQEEPRQPERADDPQLLLEPTIGLGEATVRIALAKPVPEQKLRLLDQIYLGLRAPASPARSMCC